VAAVSGSAVAMWGVIAFASCGGWATVDVGVTELIILL
jgi:hypothetical protein